MASLAKPSLVHHQMRPRKVRSKSGCLTCRTRRKKCDEGRPECGNCMRWQVPCTWPTFQITGPSDECVRTKRSRRTPNAKSKSKAEARLEVGHEDIIKITQQVALSPQLSVVPTPHSSSSPNLLEYFILEGSRGLCGRAPWDDPFVRLALQLSHFDEMIENGVLAISASRMAAAHGSAQADEAALCHYNQTLGQLRKAVDSWPPKTGEEMIRLLTGSILLCHYEAMLGNERDSLQSHLRACREMVHLVQDHPSTQHYSAIFGVLFEAYGYYSIQTILRYSASELDIQASIDSKQFYQSLTAYSTFGYLMQANFHLYSLVPYVALFGIRMRETSTEDRTEDLETTYRGLESRIHAQHPCSLDEAEPSIKVASIYRNSLLIILHASYHCDTAEQITLKETLGPILSETLSLFGGIKDEFAAAPAFWPMVIVGSCLSNAQDQARLLEYMELGGATTAGIQRKAKEALQWIWNQHSPESFGPPGLERFGLVHNTGLCIG